MGKEVSSTAVPEGQSNNNKVGHKDVLTTVFSPAMESSTIGKGLANLSLLPHLDINARTPAPYKGKPFTPAQIGLVRFGKDIQIVVAAEGAPPRYFAIEKYVTMVEFADDPKYATVVLQNPQAPTARLEGRGQVLARILPEHSAINIALGNQGVPIRDESDILRIDNYQVDSSLLAAYYMVCRYQVKGEDRLNELIACYEGIRYFELSGEKSGVQESISSLLG